MGSNTLLSQAEVNDCELKIIESLNSIKDYKTKLGPFIELYDIDHKSILSKILRHSTHVFSKKVHYSIF